MMRLFFSVLMIVCFVLLGCSASVQQEENYAVSITGLVHHDTYNKTAKVLTDTISFIMTNNEDSDLDCFAVLRIDNSTNSTALRGRVGVLGPGEQKNVSMDFIMYSGQSDISILAECAP